MAGRVTGKGINSVLVMGIRVTQEYGVKMWLGLQTTRRDTLWGIDDAMDTLQVATGHCSQLDFRISGLVEALGTWWCCSCLSLDVSGFVEALGTF